MSKISDLWVTVFQNGDRDPIRAALSRRKSRGSFKDTDNVPGFHDPRHWTAAVKVDGKYVHPELKLDDQEYCGACGAWVIRSLRTAHLDMHDDINFTKMMLDGIWEELGRDKEIIREYLDKEKEKE